MPNMPTKDSLTGNVTQGGFKASLNTLWDFLSSLLGTDGSKILTSAGGKLTGPLELAGDPTEDLHPVPLRYLNKYQGMPFGYSNLKVKNVAISFTGTTTNGSPNITGISAADINKIKDAGSQAWISNTTGITNGTTISSIGVNSITLSANATASGTVTVTAYMWYAINLTADYLVLRDAQNRPKMVDNVNVTCLINQSGVNGLDTGTAAGSTWYALHTIYNPSTNTLGLIASLNFAKPELPDGFTFWGRYSSTKTDGTANKIPLRLSQDDNIVSYKIIPGTNTANTPVMATNYGGSTSTPTWIPISILNFVPPTAILIKGNGNGPGDTTWMIASNPNFGAFNSSNNQPLVFKYAGVTGAGPGFELKIESSNIYAAGQATGNTLVCYGYTDNL